MHLSHNALYLPPKICIIFQVVFHFSWVLQLSQKKMKIMLMKNFGGQIRCIMGDVQVAYIGVVLFFVGPDFVSENKMLDLL